MNVKSCKTYPKIALPLAVFISVLLIHFLWNGYSPYEEAQAQWVEIENTPPWWWSYFSSQDYFLGFSYGISFAFTAVAFRSYREKSFCNSSKFAFGGLSFSGALAIAGCFIVGCCGSPMLLVYSSMFGMKYANLAKPLVAALTSLIVAVSWFWMKKKKNFSPAVKTVTCLPTESKNDKSCC